MSTAIPGNEWVGRVIDGRFALQRWLGGTGQSSVFLTEAEGFPGQKVAIKLIAADNVDPEACIADWAATATLRHPHLMHVSHSGRCQVDDVDLLYIVTEYADEILSEILLERPLTPEEAGEMLKPVLGALGYLHEQGFAHGHLKPSNIMVVGDGIKLSADGLQAANHPVEKASAPSVYDAPERIASPAADVWSLGVTLVETLTQHPPSWDQATNGDPVVPDAVPQSFADIAKACLRLDPAQRCTLSEIAAHLESGQPILQVSPSAPVPAPAAESVKKAPFNTRIWALAGGGVILIVVVAVALLRSHTSGSPSQPTTPAAVAPAPPSSAGHTQPALSPKPVPGEAQPPAQAVVAPVSPQPAVEKTQTPSGSRVKGEVAQQILPEVPRKASDTIQGRVNLAIRVEVDPEGKVSDATFEKQGPSRYFADLALNAARSWTFKPAEVDGRAVASTWILRFQFKTTGVTVTPVEVSP